MVTEHEFSEKCGQIIKSDDFIDSTADNLDQWGSSIVRGFLDRANIPWKVSRQKVGPGYVIKIEDKYLKYLLIMPHKSYEGQVCDQFYWMIGTDPNNDDHSIDPNAASAYLISIEIPGARIVNVRGDDGSSVTRIAIGDKSAELRLPPGFLDDKTWAKDDNNGDSR